MQAIDIVVVILLMAAGVAIMLHYEHAKSERDEQELIDASLKALEKERLKDVATYEKSGWAPHLPTDSDTK